MAASSRGHSLAVAVTTGPIVYSAGRKVGILTGSAAGRIVESHVDDKIKQLLRELGTAINESISGSDDVNRQIQKIRDEGYNLYVVLDATIGLNRQDEEGEDENPGELEPAEVAVRDEKEIQFRINVNDLSLLRALGIDPTRKVRTARRVEPLAQNSDEC
jgi:hypothetical protein